LVFIILAPVEVIRKRINNKDVLHKILSNKQLERISAHYKLLPTIFKNYKFVFLDGTKSIEELFKLVIKNVNVYLKWERKDEDCN
jgi:thymidylate kinase